VNLEINSFVHSPNAYCLLVNINRGILQRIKTVPVLSGYTGIVRSIPVYLVLTMQCIRQELVLTSYSIPGMYTAIPRTK